MFETASQGRIRSFYAEQGARVWRNNVGVLKNEDGIPVRFGLANDSKRLNEDIKSGDLIGWMPRLITPDMVGSVIAQFLSIEAKPEDWTRPLSGKAFRHVAAQIKWADLVRSDGGIAGIMRNPEEGFIL